MEPHQERVVQEKKDLDDKMDKLKKFIEENPIFKTLPTVQRGLLSKQFDVMYQYSSILRQRIEAFE